MTRADLVGRVLQDLGASEDDMGPVSAHRQPLLGVPCVAGRLEEGSNDKEYWMTQYDVTCYMIQVMLLGVPCVAGRLEEGSKDKEYWMMLYDIASSSTPGYDRIRCMIGCVI